MPRLVAVRHGETEWNREHRVQGWEDSPLTDRGRAQTRALATRLADRAFDRAVVSDLGRARATARILVAAGACPDPEVDERWRERNYGAFQSLTYDEIVEREGIEAGTSVALAPPPADAETLDAFAERVRTARTALADRLGPGECALVVTHGGVVRALLAAATGTPIRAAYRRFSPPNCALAAFDVDGAGALTLRETDVEGVDAG